MNKYTSYHQITKRVSASLLKLFEDHPSIFKKAYDGELEMVESPKMKEGTMKHKYILEPYDFYNCYEVCDYETPGSKNQKEFIEYYERESKMFDDAGKDTVLIEAYRRSYKNAVKDDDLVLVQAKKLLEKLKPYLTMLEILDDGKIPISYADLECLKKTKEAISKHKKANALLLDEDNPEIIKQSEHVILWEAFKVDGKSQIDRLLIDKQNKKIIIVDFKTTKSLSEFRDVAEHFKYKRQVAVYRTAVEYELRKEYGHEIADEYEFEHYIVAIDSDYNVEVFSIISGDIESALDEVEDLLKKIKYHLDMDDFSQKTYYYTGDGTTVL